MTLDLKTNPKTEAMAFEARLHGSPDAIASKWRAMETEGVCYAFQRLDWTRKVLAHLAGAEGTSALFVEVIDRATRRPVMILPLTLTRRRGCSTIGWYSFDVCDYAAPVLADGPDLSSEACLAAWDSVKSVLPRADLIHISQIPAKVGHRCNPLAALHGRRPIALPAFGSPIDGDPETLLRRLCRSSTLRDMGKQRRRLERAGAVRFSCARTPEEVEELFATLVEQRLKRFGDMGRVDLLTQPSIQDFYHASALDGLSGGAVRLFGLWVDGQTVATFYGLMHGDTFQGLILTMSDDKAWRTASPGVQIVAEALQWSRSQGLTYFDLSVGDLPYKREFGLAHRQLEEVVQPLTLKGWLIVFAMRSAEAMKAKLRQYPAAQDRIEKLRRGLRTVRPSKPDVARGLHD